MGTNQLDVFYSNTLTDRIIVGTTTGVIQCLHEVELQWPLVHVNLAEAEQKRRPEIKQEGLDAKTKPAAKPGAAEPKPAAGGEDPFGEGGAKPAADGAKPAMDGADPFGGGAAPKPAADAADPFGGGVRQACTGRRRSVRRRGRARARRGRRSTAGRSGSCQRRPLQITPFLLLRLLLPPASRRLAASASPLDQKAVCA